MQHRPQMRQMRRDYHRFSFINGLNKIELESVLEILRCCAPGTVSLDEFSWEENNSVCFIPKKTNPPKSLILRVSVCVDLTVSVERMSGEFSVFRFQFVWLAQWNECPYADSSDSVICI